MELPVQLTDLARAGVSCRDDVAVIVTHSLAGWSSVGRIDAAGRRCRFCFLLPSVLTGLRRPLHVPREAFLLRHHAESFAVQRPSTLAVRIQRAVCKLGPITFG